MSDALTYDVARRVADAAVDAARLDGVTATVVVVDAAGTELVRLRLDGGSLASATLAGKKAYTAVSTRSATSSWVERAEQNPAVGIGLFSFPNFCPLPGGLPLSLDGVVVGAVGVSGGTVAEDEKIATAAVEALGRGPVDSV